MAPLRRSGLAACAAVLLVAGAAPAAAAEQVSLAWHMGRKALLVIDGQTVTLGVGETRQGVRLVSLEGGQARVEWNGRTSTLLPGGAPVSIAGDAAPAAGSREIVLAMGPGGHFRASGRINGRPVRFLVDTGATVVAMSVSDADRIGLAYREGQRVRVGTANGQTTGWAITLSAVSLGEVTVANVNAVVLQAPMGHVLLGNSFLQRFQMQRDNDVMRLQLR